MALYTRESRDRVRDAVDFVELVSARTELRRAGQNRYEGLCPFHDERTPSFGIDPGQKVYHCFGCQASGDLFTFVQETEGVDFKGALELLAQRTGVELELEQEDPREAQRRKGRERLLELLARTAGYYERVLWESSEAAGAREYLTGRGLGEESLRAYGVGYAPSAWDKVLLASLRSGYTEAELLAAGLAQRSREAGRPYDRFRRRIMFPLADVRGRVLGFGAREMGDRPEGERRGPKYLNTSETELFQKGHHLYGAHLARAQAARAGSVILCEGYTDVIAMHQAGIVNVVGSMGTALTERQLAELSRIASTVLLALDADSAGQEAMLKAAKLAAGRRLEMRVVALPGGLDPADLIQREGAAAMTAAVEKSVPFVRFQVEHALTSGDLSTPEGRDKIIEQLRPIFAVVPPSALRLDLERLVASRLALPDSLMEGLLAGAGQPTEGSRAVRSVDARGGPSGSRGGQPGSRGGQPDNRGGQPGSRGGQPDNRGGSGGAGGAARPREVRRAAPAPSTRRRQAEQAFLSLCLASPDLGAEALAEVRPQEHFSDAVLRRIAERLRDGDLREPMASVDDSDAEAKHVLAEIVVEAGRGGATEAMLRVSSLQLELGHLDRMIQAARIGAAGAELRERESEVSDLARRRADVKRDFDAAQELALQDGGA